MTHCTNNKSMKKKKSHYQSIPLPKFWFWAYYENGYHFFQKYSWLMLPPDGEKYSLMKCKEEDCTESNLALMIEMNLSRA